uniref:Uncharacterized protein n=1 Tax=Heterorhabditis bacteriophora TaxID=37862 RepID=A0A1I7XL21_HETBA
MTPSGQTAPKRPKLSTLLPKGKWELSAEAKPRLNRALKQMPRLEKALKNREEKSPVNLRPSRSSKLTVQVLGNLPYFGWQLLNRFTSDEFGKKKEKETKSPFGS